MLNNIKTFAERNVATTYFLASGDVIGFIDTSDTEPFKDGISSYESMPYFHDKWFEDLAFTASDKVTAFENHNALVTLMKNLYGATPVNHSFCGVEVLTDKETAQKIKEYRESKH